jgi:hypothetical protein
MSLKTALVVLLTICVSASATLGAGEHVRTFTMTFSEQALAREPHRLLDDEYDLIKMGDLDLTRQLGHPCLPVKIMNMYVPRGKRIVGLRVESTKSRTLAGDYLLLPAQQEQPISSTQVPAAVGPDAQVYAMTDAYPESPVKIASGGSMGGRQIAGIMVYPLQYVPGERKVRLNEEIVFSIELAASESDPQIPAETRNVRLLRNDAVSRLVANPGDVELDFPPDAAPLDPSVATEYLILCLAAHADEYGVLKDWKTRKGIPARIVTIEDVIATYPGDDTPDQLRNCIIDYYLNESLAWVTLTLSAPKAKIRGCYGEVGGTIEPEIPCDLYFADMDGDWDSDNDGVWGEVSDDVDLYPDVYVGRISANKGLQCSTVVHKILTYEGCYSLPTDYQLEMLFMAEYLDDYTDAAVIKNLIDSESVPSRFDPITKLYENDGSLSNAAAMAALNSGMNIVNHAGHGNITFISISPDALTTSHMESLTNAPRYTVFYTLACDPGAFDYETGYFARSFMEAEAGGGFIVANSRLGWYWSGNPGYGTGDRYDREFFESIFVRDYTHLGVAHADAKVQRIPQSGGNGTNRWAQFSLNLFGDPETDIWIDTPITTTATHPDTIETGSQVFAVSVSAGGSPLAQARVCLWKGDDIYEVDETNAGGSASFSIAPADTGTMLVTVAKDGYLPYLGSTWVGDVLSGITAGGASGHELRVNIAPNPVTGSATIAYSLPRSAGDDRPRLRIYDAAGRLIADLAAPDTDTATGKITWDGRLNGGGSAPPGIYFLNATNGEHSAAVKFVILH